MYVFRDGRQAVSGPILKAQLADALRAVPVSASQARGGSDQLIEALLRAGELECALADAQHSGEEQLACVTDGLAAHLVGDPVAPAPATLLAWLPSSVPATVHVSPPEGFAYYALHPCEMADLAAEAPSRSHHAFVVGVRTIGVTLSAVVAAQLRKSGKHVRRLTVRPGGHPYDRRTEFSDEQKRVICQYRNAGADFLVVDEGPGMSGSSFLSVADALVAARVSRDRITLLCSREPDVSQLRAANAQQRWPQHRALHVRPNSFLPENAKIYIGAGLWREHLLPPGAEWPATWLHMERLKFLSPDKRTLYKFEGFGRYGRAVQERARVLQDSGFGPECVTSEYGFGVYPIAEGRTLTAADLSENVLLRIADYCAMRAKTFHAVDGHAPEKMEEMARFNFHEEFGREVHLRDGALASDSPIIADGHMQPHEWFQTSDGRILKLDGTEHGDDHFFPGPTDVAWDLAGAIVEWNMDAAMQEAFLREYRHALGSDDLTGVSAGRNNGNGAHHRANADVTRTNDELTERVSNYVLAYSSFRMGYCKMAAEAVRGSGEEHRLWAAYERYRDYLAALALRKPEAALQKAAAIRTDSAHVRVADDRAEIAARDKGGHDREERKTPAIGILDGPSPEPLAA
jgi:hypothetical protein